MTKPPSTLDNPIFEMRSELVERLGVEVDVVALETASPYLVHRVFRDGVIVFESDKASASLSKCKCVIATLICCPTCCAIAASRTCTMTDVLENRLGDLMTFIAVMRRRLSGQ